MGNGACADPAMIRFGITPSWFVLGAAILLFVLSLVWFIRGLRNTYYPKTVNIVLAALRLAAMLIFLLLLLDLKIETVHDKQMKPRVAFLWDMSESMILSDSSYDVKNILGSDAYRDLAKKTDLSHIVYMEQPRFVDPQDLRAMTPAEKITDISALLRFAEKQAEFREIVLISDGNSYLGETPGQMMFPPSLAINTIGVGDKPGQGQPVLRAVNMPRFPLAGDSVSIEWTLSNPGEQEINTDVIIKNDGSEVFRQSVSIPPYRLIRGRHVFAPQTEGTGTWSWFAAGEGTEHKIGERLLHINPSQVNVLCYADPPDRDIAMVSTVLSSLEKYRVFNRETWNAEKAGQIPDLVVQTWAPEKNPRIFENVPALLFVRDPEASYRKTSELDISAVRPYVRFRQTLSDNARCWSQLPPVQVSDRTVEGEIILKTPDGLPVVTDIPSERAVIVNASGMWRWNLAGFEKDWDGIYRHLIEETSKALLKGGDKHYIAFDETVLNGFEYLPLEPAFSYLASDMGSDDISVRVSLTDSSFSEIKRQTLKAGQELKPFVVDEAGRYYAIAAAFYGADLLESDTSRILISENDMEIRLTGCNEQSLRMLAERNRGHFVHMNDIDSLRTFISTEKKWASITRVHIARKAWPLYLLMFLLLCADWVIRKRFGGI